LTLYKTEYIYVIGPSVPIKQYKKQNIGKSSAGLMSEKERN